MTVIQFSHVSKTYAQTTILKALNFSINAGERVVVVGPSGSGKTTLLRLIAGFLAPDKGQITLRAQTVSREGEIILPPERRGLGMVFQDLALWPHLTVYQNLELGLKARKIPAQQRAQKINHMLTTVGLQNKAHARPGELSGGEQQRVALARALILQPDILLMDEPLANLDWELNKHLREELVRLQEQLGFTLLYVTHSREEILHIATRVLVLRKGVLEFIGTTREAEAYLFSRW